MYNNILQYCSYCFLIFDFFQNETILPTPNIRTVHKKKKTHITVSTVKFSD